MQSFDSDLQARIGRIHSAEDVYRSVDLIRQSGINNLNLDLMFGLPGQTFERWCDNLGRAVDLGPEHLSLYALTIEEGTTFFYQSSIVTDEDLQADMYTFAVAYLQGMGTGSMRSLTLPNRF